MIERFIPTAGGVEQFAWNVAHELLRQGEQVTVVARASDPSSEVAVEPLRVPTTWQPARVLSFTSEAARRVRSRPFDVVHSFARTHYQDLYRAGGGSHHDYLRRNHLGMGLALRRFSPRHRVLLAVEQRVFQDPKQRIQCASRLVADALQRDHGVDPSRILLLPNAVHAGDFSNPRAREDGLRLRTRLDARAERIWLLAGSGWRRKGLETAFEALAHNGDPGARLWIAGRDDPSPWQRKASVLGIADHVRFLGPRSDMPAVYAAADAAILPTRYDPFANATLEAAAAGLAVVTTAADGASEWLASDAFVIEEPSDGQAFASALRALSDVDSRRARGERLARRARELDFTSHVRALRAEYGAIVDRRRRVIG